MRRIINIFNSSPFLRHNAVFFFGSLVVSGINYLFNPIMGRLMSPTDFGEVQVLFSIFMQAAIFLTILSLVTVHITVNVDNEADRNNLLFGLERLAILLGLGLLLIGFMAMGQLKNFLHFRELSPFIALLVALGLCIPRTFQMAFLRARKKFGWAVSADGVAAFVKLIAALILVLVGFKVFGAILGLAIAQAVALFFGKFMTKREGLVYEGADKSIDYKRLRPQLKLALAIFVSSSVVTALLSLDLITIKHYFSPNEAGLYAGISTVAGIVYFAASPITTVMVTLISMNESMSRNRLRLGGSLILIAGLAGTALIALVAMPKFIISIFVSSKFLKYYYLLPREGLVMLIMAFANALLVYGMTLKKYYLIRNALIVLAGTVLLLAINHGTMASVINNMLIGSSCLAVSVAAQIFWSSKRAARETND